MISGIAYFRIYITVPHNILTLLIHLHYSLNSHTTTKSGGLQRHITAIWSQHIMVRLVPTRGGVLHVEGDVHHLVRLKVWPVSIQDHLAWIQSDSIWCDQLGTAWTTFCPLS